MIKVNIYNYYSFGYNYYLLLNESAGKTISDFYFDFNKYIELVKSLDLSVTRSSLEMQGINIDIKKLEDLVSNPGERTKKVPKELHSAIIEKLRKADTTLDAELNIKHGYLLEKKRFSIDTLTENINELFAKDVFDYLPDIAQFDFKECGKCLAFDRYTASAFHALRGTEDTLKFFYSKVLNKQPKDTQTWGSYYTEINKEIQAGNIKPSPSIELLDNLENLRKFYRNKTQHPQLTYDSDEIQDLIFISIKTVNQMMKYLIDRGLVVVLPF